MTTERARTDQTADSRQPFGHDFVRCERCQAMHHPNYHEPFRWGRRVLLHVAWLDTKRLARSYWKAIVHG